MNVNDIEMTEEYPEDLWAKIFEKQKALADKYKDIECMGNLLETLEDNIYTAKGQKWIKDFAWRVTEELAEAFEAKLDRDRARNDNLLTLADEFNTHYIEEIIDALHFLVELTIIAGYDADLPKLCTKIDTSKIDNGKFPAAVVYYLGLMCNTLKNKPWKQTQMLTDENKFLKYLENTWSVFLSYLKNEVGDDKMIYLFYFKKNEINKFRQRSKY